MSNSDWLSRRLPDLPDENGRPGNFLNAAPRTDKAKEIVCTSRIQHLEHRIAFQLEVMAQLICQDKFALGAVKLLDELTSELVAAKLELGAIGEASASRRTVPAEKHGDLFYPEDLRILANLFDEAVAALPPDRRTIANRTQIAKLVLARGATREAKSDPNHSACVLGDSIDHMFNCSPSNQIEVPPSSWRNSA
ncbi:putative coiled-coil protein SlyX [Bradyrhizobium sp. F1.13.3]